MGFLGDFSDFLDPERPLERSWQKVKELGDKCVNDIFEEQERALQQAMIDQGWEETPIITEGKLEVEPELGEERKWWQLW